MHPSHSPEQRAIASQLATALCAYEQGLERLLQRGWDADLYRSLSDQFDSMQMRAAALPVLAASWSELLITRVELTHALWSQRAPTRIDGRVIALHAQHRQAIGEVLRGCREYGAVPCR
jgi:DNA-binding GntR family transcriptional regulator